MEDIIAPISKELLKAELTEDKRLRMTNKSNNIFHLPSFYFFIFNVQLTIYTRYLSHTAPIGQVFSSYRMFARE